MRRNEERKEKQKQIWMGIILVAVMVFSIFGIMVGNDSSTLRYGNYKFQIGSDNKVYTEVSNGNLVGFRYLPQDLENITLPEGTIQLLRNAPIIVTTFNPNYEKTWVLTHLETIEFEMSKELEGKYIYNGVTEASEAYVSFPMINCSNATQQQPVIYFEISNETSITTQNSCIILKSDDTGFYVLKDRLLYSYFGVIE